ncbi:dual specificity mitogen-activated protein kinase kinase 7-like isoform X2 [Strongylocentrotus purpuratus]|uniref:Protein kinase domain-containing protein n=1 Tax=Strongylocentrotus purpuratus TaxID=7668 RepID=A0A7M7NR28_STRPU|nr:dual specificity mitogen-activated protein kinase kinase 7-like isoform X2 [Strongylocentrotus purpuratus]
MNRRDQRFYIAFCRPAPRYGQRGLPTLPLQLNHNGGLSPHARRDKKQVQMPLTCGPINRSTIDGPEIDRKLQEIMKQTGLLTTEGKRYHINVESLESIGELGFGSCGHVIRMRHKESGTILAVKQMRRSGNKEENKRILMDLDVVLKSHNCPFIVQCLGAIVTPVSIHQGHRSFVFR